MKHLLILLAAVAVFSSCRRSSTSSGTVTPLACWQCAIEGTYNGKIVDIDTSICNMTQDQINQFMAQHNTSAPVVSCSLATE